MTATPTPTAATPTPTPEELAARVGWPHESGMRLCGEKDIAAAIRSHAAPLEAQIAELTAERDRLIADWRGEKADAEQLDEHAGALECTLERVRGELAASQERETALREALEGMIAAYPISTSVAQTDAIIKAYAALKPKEPANE